MSGSWDLPFQTFTMSLENHMNNSYNLSAYKYNRLLFYIKICKTAKFNEIVLKILFSIELRNKLSSVKIYTTNISKLLALFENTQEI